jgi:hypothetical protein
MPRLQPSRFKETLRRIKRWFRREPEDPHAYVMARKKPRLPHLNSAAVAELPDKR